MSENSEKNQLQIGTQIINEDMLNYMPLEDLDSIYSSQTDFIEDTDDLCELGADLRLVLDTAEKMARDELEEVGVENGPFKATYSPSLKGAKPGECDEIKVGRPGRCERPYYLVTELSHEMLHQYIEHDLGIENEEPEELAREEGLCQVWNLYRDDLLVFENGDGLNDARENRSESAIEERLEDMQNVYNEYMKDGYGDQIRWFADRLVSMFYDELEGSEEDRMEKLLAFGFKTMQVDE